MAWTFTFSTELNPITVYSAVVATGVAVWQVDTYFRDGPRLRLAAAGNQAVVADAGITGATYCIEAFAQAGLEGVRGGKADEVGIRGLGRQKDWDLAFVLADKPRLLVSLKSILKNLSGVVPNRLDDLMGEAANVQQRHVPANGSGVVFFRRAHLTAPSRRAPSPFRLAREEAEGARLSQVQRGHQSPSVHYVL